MSTQPVSPVLPISPTGNVIEALLHLAEAIGSTSTLKEIYDAALDGIQQALGIERASILLFDPDGVLRFKAWRGLSDGYRAAVEGHTPWSPGQLAPAPVLVPDVRLDDTLRAYVPVFDREGIVALAFFPLLSQRRVLGKFMLYRGQPHDFSGEEANLALAIGHQIGFAVERTGSAMESRRNHQRVLFALDAAQMGTWEWNIGSREIRWSEQLERVHGMAPGQFDGQWTTYEREIHPEDRERVLASLNLALTEGAVHDVEYRIVAADGTVRWVHGRGRVEHDADGRPSMMSGVCMDISARKGAEEEVEAALRHEASVRDRLTVLTAGAQQLLSSLDADSVTAGVLSLAQQVVSADACAVWRFESGTWRVADSYGLGEAFTAVTVTGVPSFTFDQPIIVEQVESTAVVGTAATAAILASRRRHYAREGIRSFVTVPLLLRGEASGSIAFYYRSEHTPTEMELQVAVALGQLAGAAIASAQLYAAQQDLRAEAVQSANRSAFLAEASALLSSLDYEANLRRVADLAVPGLGDWCAVDLLDDHGSIRRIAVSHIDREKVRLVQDASEHYPARPDEKAGAARVIRTGVPELHAEIPDAWLVAAAHDEEHLALLRALELRSAIVVPLATGGVAFGALTLVSTSTGRRYVEADLDFASELARRAAYAVENARLYREAQAANRLKDEFLATLSHELRTPLNVIMGRAKMLQTAAGDSEAVRSAAATITRNGTALNRLVEDLLDLSRISVGQFRLEASPVRLADVLDAAVQGVQPAATAKGLHLEIEIDRTAPAITGDATRLQQVVWNLLANAVKFTPAGGAITVSLRSEPTELLLEVSDTGIGIDAAFLPHVFDLFRQAEAARDCDNGGLGLGLSIVRRLVELHGGTVTAASLGIGRGAAFTVRFPRQPRNPEKEPEPASRQPGPPSSARETPR